ncbi:MAG: hypothetical protein UT56_C0005G0007 [Candidatus Levybacteria bacterium GW2011_GWB1_39_7]|nr:MAG: hypothetical protein UT20_C0008G0005 [Candidatus Levybacteria bacterium GW2011_GWA1_39_11]KKR24962.1 MAG: hypothetical protein UT56_C0005G0007 [Candidatus Levybacteria bacterium GW2011_GWB1_39_7]KKR49812.1 MAG: hypothetical protein UT85_C0010G0008 [Candidatus Levybacteria bacterium GW2011_GWA2_40_16]
MLNIDKIRKSQTNIITIGSYPAIIASMLDFDYLSKKEKPSIKAIIAAGRKFERYFFGRREILIPVFPSFDQVPESKRLSATFFLNLSSGRRVLTSSIEAINKLPALVGGAVFAENTPEKHAVELKEYAKQKGVFIIGPSSVGIIVPSKIKLGAVGGVDYKQIISAKLLDQGSIAVLSASGGMTNELINILANTGKTLSFSLSFGGDRFPMVTPSEAILAAERDPQTSAIVYFGELGGKDEYHIAQLLNEGKITKPIICYIAGTVAEMFPTSPQFGHAKAMAKTTEETAKAKRDALKQAGAKVAESFKEFVKMIEKIPRPTPEVKAAPTSGVNKLSKKDIIESMHDRNHALISTSISGYKEGKVLVLGEELLDFAKNHSFAYIVASIFLGKKIKSRELEEFVDFILRLLVDHGPYVSGAVNTIVSSRAGRDLVSSLASGILTIGPRFGGAINQAAENWLVGITSAKSPSAFVEEFASKKIYISGIGHRKYRSDMPDPRVAEIISYSEGLEARFTSFAREVEKITVGKKGNLILNVDGAIACVLLDILNEKEGYSVEELKKLVEVEFFNALFVLSRSVGFIGHYLDQKRLDEGVFRLEEEHVAQAEIED